MAKTVYVVFDTELEKIVGTYDNPEAADDCENAAPGDRYTESMVLEKEYNEEEDPRNYSEDIENLDEDRVRPYDDDKFYELDEDERDPYGD